MSKLSMTTSWALTIVALMSAIISLGFMWLELPTTVVFFLAITGVSLIAVLHGFTMSELQEYFLDGCRKAILLIAIMMAVGCVIGSWIAAGIVPTMIYYGLKMIAPSVFLVVALLICSITAIATGSAYTTVGTVGIALLGIGTSTGIPTPLVAGTIISGTVFGDKMSPFSDTTLLASGVAGTDVFQHIKSMLYTTIPAYLISGALYWYLGLRYTQAAIDLSKIDRILTGIDANFTISPLLLVVPAITIVLAGKKTPPLAALFISAVLGTIVALLFQASDVKTVLQALGTGYHLDSGVPEVDDLLNRGGISSMMGTVALAVLALGFGEMLLKMGVLEAMLTPIRAALISPFRLIGTTLASCLLTNILTASQYVAIILPGEALRPAYRDMRISARVLSRTLEDGGTVFAFIVPWSMAAVNCGIIMGIPNVSYYPYAFLCFLCPLIALVYAATGFAIFRDEGSPETTD